VHPLLSQSPNELSDRHQLTVIQVEWELEPEGSVVAKLGLLAFRGPRAGASLLGEAGHWYLQAVLGVVWSRNQASRCG
jgi:hypothetical protein